MKSSSLVFADQPSVRKPRAVFDRSSDWRGTLAQTTSDVSFLYPVYFDEILPGDTTLMKARFFARLATPIVPFMDNLYFDVQAWYCPNRILWTNFEKQMGARTNPGDSIDYLTPQVTGPNPSTGFPPDSFEDCLGLPLNAAPISYAAYARRMYARVWNDWYRDEQKQNSVTNFVGDGPEAYGDFGYEYLPRGKRADYFSTLLLAPQRGPGVSVPIGPITRVPNAPASVLYNAGTNTPAAGTGNPLITNGSNVGYGSAPSSLASVDNSAGLTVLGGTINQLRMAEAVQSLLEHDNRGGSRYIEVVKEHFGVSATDDRLQRPEFLGSVSIPINVNPIAQTSSTDNVTPQGNLAAMGTANGELRFTKSYVEHGHIMLLASLRGDLTYSQGMDRMFTRRTRYDYYWPSLANVGDMAVLSQELYFDSNPTNNALVLGYAEAWADYRTRVSRVTGKFRTLVNGNVPLSGNLGVWSLSQAFDDRPILNSVFIRSAPAINRISAVPSQPKLLVDAHYNLKHVRAIPMFAVPQMGVRL